MRLPANGWRPRDYQRPMWDYLMSGGKRVSAIWHRRSGKDEVCLNWTGVAAHTRVGNYWHMLPHEKQARKALWDAVNPHTGIRRIDEAFPVELRKRTREQLMQIEFKVGSTWQAVGSDNYNAMVGSPPLGMVFSEWPLADPQAWAMLRPILLENDGWAIFVGTPRGNNHGKRTHDLAATDPNWFGQLLTVEDTTVFTPEQMQMELHELRAQYGPEVGQAMFEQEYMCSFQAAILGAYFSAEIMQLRKRGRISDEYDHVPGVPVHTAWDLGWRDPTSIVFFQELDGGAIRVIDYFHSTGASIADYARVLEDLRVEKGYLYGAHLGPHDLNNHYIGAESTTFEFAGSVGLHFEVVPKGSKEDGIQAIRRWLPRCSFHASNCEHLVNALEQHHQEYDESIQTFKINPKHDWTSHPVDAFKTAAMAPTYMFSRTWETAADASDYFHQKALDEADRVAV